MKHRRLIFILLLGLGLRLINLNQSLWLDEASQVLLSSHPLSQVWWGREGDFHPPLFYFLAHFWLQFGRSEVWLRLLPVFFGVLNLVVIYHFAQKMFSRGHLAAFLLAIAPFHIYYSQEFRSYSLLCLLATLAMYFLYRRQFFWLSLTNTLLLYTHYSSVFLLVAQFVYLLFYSPRDLKKYTLGSIFSAVLFLPWLPQFRSQLAAGSNIDEILPGWRSVLSISPLKAFPVILFKLVAGRINFLNRYLYGVYILFVFAVSFAAFVLTRHPQKRFVTVWLLVPIIALLTTSLTLPQNQPFRVIFVLPALVLLFSGAINRFPKLFLTFIIYISVVGNIAYYTRPRLQREQWRQAVEFLTAHPAPVVVKFPGRFAPLEWYGSHLEVIAATPTLPAQPAEVTSVLAPILFTSSRLYLLQYLTDLSDPQRLVDLTIQNAGYTQANIHNFEGVGFIYEYTRNDENRN